MTRVLMLGPVNHPHVEHLALAMQERGLDVIAAGDSEPTLPPSLLPDAGIHVRRPGQAAPDAGRRRRARALDPGAGPRAAAGRGARPLDVRLRGVRGAGRRVAAGRDGVGLRRAARGPDPDVREPDRAAPRGVAMADSQALVDRLVELGARPEATLLVNWGVDLATFAPADGTRSALRQLLGLGPGPVILSPRSLTPVYNPDTILAAFDLLAEALPDAQLVLKHMGEGTADLERLAARERVHVVGHVPYERMAGYYQAADVCVSIPSSDSSPRSVWEAMACGCPVVVSDLPWVRELITPERDALVVPIEAHAVSDAIRRVLEDRGSPPASAAAAGCWRRRTATGAPRWTGSPTSTASSPRDPGGRHHHRPARVRHSRAEWDPLVAAMPRPSPFLLHGWLLEWWRHHSRRNRLAVHVAREGDRLTGALPLFVEHRRGLRIARFLGKDAAALADVLVADGAHPSTVELLVERAAGAGADFADLFGLPESSRLAAAAGTERLRLVPRAEAPVLDLEAGWDEVYRAKTSAKRRNLHRRRRKQLGQLGEVSFEVARDLEELAPALEDAFRLHEARWRDLPEASGFATPVGQQFHRAALAALAPLGVPRIGLLRVDGEAVACNYFFLFGGCMYFHELAFDPLLARWSPGQIATLDSIEAAAAEGARRVEFLGGAERYKLELADRLEPLHQGLGLEATLRGRTALAARKRAVHARMRLKETPVRRLYYDGLAPARRIARLASSSTSARRGTSAPGGSPDRPP